MIKGYCDWCGEELLNKIKDYEYYELSAEPVYKNKKVKINISIKLEAENSHICPKCAHEILAWRFKRYSKES